MHLRRFASGPCICAALSLLASCTSGGGSGDETSRAPATLERFATLSSMQLTVDPAGTAYATVPQGPPTEGPHQQAALLYRFLPQGEPQSSVSMINPGGLASDAAGNIYFTETRSCVMHFCDADAQKVAVEGTVTKLSVAGDPVNGQASAPGTLRGIAVDAQGTVYVADFDNVIRKLAADGTQSTLAGDPLRCAEVDGKGGLASFCGPDGLAIDSAGNVYVADRAGDTIRKVTPDGDVTTVAGMAFVAGSADGPAFSATFNAPSQVAVDGAGNLYVADTGNALIREISASGTVTTLAGTRGAQGFTPGPLPGVLDPPTSIALHGNDLYFAMPSGIGRIANLR